jgi:hypothetical protein
MPQKSKQSAKGAEYESQGQVPSKARHVAPGCDMHDQMRPERPKYYGYYALSALDQIVFSYQGRRAPLRFALAPGFHISRLWRSVSTFDEAKLRMAPVVFTYKTLSNSSFSVWFDLPDPD